ncbi:hypothetical protein J5N97_003765 [Dioscorea zingiberensis]|uniref:Pentatricopeptide repeat-containing protein n=1 Tax=Dioscorea zingiberensis TaxID=325984 RepID=A0A9D5D632_9LILI|nr:hypothetical protein J5N97_003765 [Dioscorea zingiberensis]
MFSCVSIHRVARFTFPSLLKDIAAKLDLNNGEKVHVRILELGLQFDRHIASSLINMYVRCGSFDYATKVFDQLPQRDVAVWNTMLSGYFHHSRPCDGLVLLARMQLLGFKPDAHSLGILLGACSGFFLDIRRGKEVHAYAFRNAFDGEQILETTLIDVYSKLGGIKEAYRVFNHAVEKNVLMWNAIIGGFCYNGLSEISLELFVLMINKGCEIQAATFTSVLMACSIGKVADFGQGVHCCVIKKGHEFDPYVRTSLLTMLMDFGRKIHGELVKRPELMNMIVQSSLLTMYMKNGDIETADAFFNSNEVEDIVVWGTMISGFCQNKKFDSALGLFHQLMAKGLKPDSTVIASVVSASSSLGCLKLGFQLHGHAIKSGAAADVFVGSGLIDFYAKFNAPDSSECVLRNMPFRNLVVYNSMISAYGRNGLVDESIRVLGEISQQGLSPDSISITSALASASSAASLSKGKMIHGYQVRKGVLSDALVENALLDMYMKCGCLGYGQRIFNSMTFKNLVARNNDDCGGMDLTDPLP